MLTVVLSLSTLVPAQSRDAILYVTTADRSSIVSPHAERSVHRLDRAATSITINPQTTFQSIDGFGFAMTGGSAELLMKMDPAARAATLQQLFGQGPGDIAVSYLRLSIGASDMNERVFTYDDVAAGDQDPTLAHFNLGPDLSDVVPVMKQVLAINPRVKILSSPWTAPSWMKTNGLPKGGSLKPEFYAVYADYLVRYLTAMRAEGISVDALTVQNEPENSRNTPSLVMTAPEQATFIKTALGPALRRAGLTTKIVLFDHNCDHPEYATAVLRDPEAARYIDGTGFHLYLGTIDAMTTVHAVAPEKNVYFTEQMTVENREGTTLKPIAEPVRRVVVGATRNWSRNVVLWNLAADPQFGPHTSDGGCPVCQGAITIDGNNVTKNIAFYTVGQIAAFVPPGSVRLGSNETAEVASVAFRRPDGKIAVIFANASSEARHFSINLNKRSMPLTLPGDAAATLVW